MKGEYQPVRNSHLLHDDDEDRFGLRKIASVCPRKQVQNLLSSIQTVTAVQMWRFVSILGASDLRKHFEFPRQSM